MFKVSNKDAIPYNLREEEMEFINVNVSQNPSLM